MIIERTRELEKRPIKALRIPLVAGLLLLGLAPAAVAQEEHHPEQHTGPAIELITSGILSYTPAEEETLLGSETHLTYWWNHTWGAGFSYTARFYESHLLSDVALLGSVNATDWLTVNLGPNFAFPNDEVREHFRMGLYAETEFNYRVSELFHFGILTGTVVSEETEFTAGIHLAFEFPLK